MKTNVSLNKTFRPVVAMMLAAVLLLLSACSGNSKPAAPTNGKQEEGSAPGAGINESGLPIVKEPITLHMLAGQSPLHGEWKNKLLWTESERLTGIQVEWNLVPQANLEEKKNLLLASGSELPDAFYGGGISTQDMISYGEQGVFIPLNDLIDRYAPNFKKLVADHPEVLKGITAPDGNIYALPKMTVNPTHRLATKLFLNKNWLAEGNLKSPTTTDELYNTLKAFKAADASRIPLTGNADALIRSLAGAWGLMNRGMSNTNIDFDEQAKALRFYPTDPKYKELLEYAHKLYNEQLIDNEMFTNNVTILTAKIAKGNVGGFINNNTTWAGQNRTDYVGLTEALKGPHGDQLWPGVLAVIQAQGAFVITKSNPHPEATMRWADFFIDGEGAVLYWMGVEGKTYEMKDGKYRFVDDIVNNKDGLTLDQAISRELVAPYTNHPIVREERFAWDTGEGLPEVIEAGQHLQPYVPNEVWPAFLYTKEENDRMRALSNDIHTYVNEMQAQFIMGKTPFSAWDDYVATIKKMGLEEYMQINTAAYDRFKS